MAQLKQKFLATNAVSTDKIVDENVTMPKLAPTMIDSASGLAVLDSNRKLSIDRIPQSIVDELANHEGRLNTLEGKQTLHEVITLTQAEVDAKAFDLSHTPHTAGLTILVPASGITQLQGADYSISGATISWNGLGLDTIGLAAGDTIQVWYDISSGGIAGDLQQEILDRQAADALLSGRIGTIEGQNLNSRIGTIEGQNLDSRQTTTEGEVLAIQNSVGNAGGIASLDGGGKVPVSQLPNSIMQYKSLWNASTNTPILVNGATNDDIAIGDVYRVSVAGIVDFGDGSIAFDVGDYAILNDSKLWEKSDTTDSVVSVNGKNGIVDLDLADFGDVQTAFTNEETTRGDADTALSGRLDTLEGQNLNSRLGTAENSITSLLAAMVPLGVIMPFAGSVAPSGYAFCDGAAYSKTTYAGLYAVIGDAYATQYDETTAANWAAPAVGTFRVPDYRASFMRGVGTPSGLDAVTLGLRQAQKTAKNGLVNAASALSSGAAASAGAHTHTVSGTTNIAHTHAASAVSGTTNIGHTHAASSISGTAAAQVFTGISHNHTSATSLLYGNGQVNTAAGSNGWAVAGGIAFSAATAGGTNAASSVTGTAGGQTLGTTNVSLASGSAAGQTLGATSVSLASGAAASDGAHTHTVSGTANAQVITGDNETRPMNKGVNYIIRIG